MLATVKIKYVEVRLSERDEDLCDNDSLIMTTKKPICSCYLQ